MLQPDGLVLPDRGFLISDILSPGTSLNIPTFLMTPQFTPGEVIRTKHIAKNNKFQNFNSYSKYFVYQGIFCIPTLCSFGKFPKSNFKIS